MKYKHNIIIFALMLLSISASAQIQFTAGLNYESGVPSGAPSSTGSRIRVNLATGRAYIWNQAGSNWRVLAQGIDIVAGCSAPLYTPGYGQSLFAVNGCASPELYYYTGTAWVQISGATYYAGEGIDITNDTISVDTVQRLSFRTDQTYSDGLGTLSWDNTNGTLQLGLKGGNVSLQLGQESVQLVKHADNTGLTKGKVVYLTGSAGGNLTVRYALANSESTSANTFGVMTEDATGGNKGFCTTFGLVHNINTSNLTEGGMVWLSKDTAGAMTAVRPTAPNNGVEVGFCVTKHATNGVIFVTVQNGYELDELHNVYAPTPSNGQVLTYNTTNARWEAATVADQSATNEIQTIDTFSLSGQTLSASLSNDAQAAKTVTLPIVDVVAGTNVTVSKANGVATVNALASQLSGVTGYVSQFNSSTTIDTTGMFWNGRLGIGTASPAARFHTVGSGNTSGTWTAQFHNSAGNNNALMIRDDGNVGIGTSSPGARLQVNGSGGTPFAVQSSTNSNLFRVNDSGVINFSIAIANAGQLEFYGRENLDNSITFRGNAASTITSGNKTHVLFSDNFIPTSGNGTYTAFRVAAIINQTGGANGVTRGLYLNPTLTSAADYRSIEWSNNSGWGLYGAGTAKSYFAGNVAIGTTSQNASSALEVSSTTQGVLFPRMTTTQRDAITTPANGLVIYNSTTDKLQVRAGGAWVDLH